MSKDQTAAEASFWSSNPKPGEIRPMSKSQTAEPALRHAMSKAWYIWLRDVGKLDNPSEVAIAKQAFEDGWVLAREHERYFQSRLRRV